MKRGLVFGAILVAALAAFELFNFSTTDFALNNFLGAERFLGIRWATILAIAFCGIDFAGLARLFTPERGDGEPVEVWYLLGAWFLGATLNAMATWWAVTLALLEHEIGNEVLDRQQVLTFVPLFVAALVWLTRILIIGTFSVAGDRLFTQTEQALRKARVAAQPQAMPQPAAEHAPAVARIIGAGQQPGRPQPAPAAPTNGQQPAQRRQSGAPTRPFTRPAPKPSEAARRAPHAAHDDDFSQAERPVADDGLAFSRRVPVGAARPANGVNGPKTIE